MIPWSTDWKLQKMGELKSRWSGCESCLLSDFRNTIVFGVGNIDSPIMLVGEAPGEQEDLDGVPFVGESGSLLRAMLDSIGMNPEDFYITNSVMCRPPNNREPTRDEKTACYDRLRNEIYIIDPYLIILIGKVSFMALTKCKDSMESSHGEIFPAIISGNTEFGGNPVPILYDAMPVYHPAYILRADSLDPKTKQWSKDGPATKTLKDIKQAVQLVEQLRKKYAALELSIRRKNHGSIP